MVSVHKGSDLRYRNDEVVLLRRLAHWEGKTVEQPVFLLAPYPNPQSVRSCVAYSFSSTTTGLGSRMAALSRPLASSALYGDTTLRPGILPYHAE